MTSAAATRELVRGALRLRAWGARTLLRDVFEPPPAAGIGSWRLFLGLERISAPLRSALDGAGVLLPDAPAALLRDLAVREATRALSVRAQLATIAAIARSDGLDVIALKSGAEIATGFVINAVDVDVLASPEHAAVLARRLDESGFQPHQEDEAWHLQPRAIAGALRVEVHLAVTGFGTPDQVPWDAVQPLPAIPPLLALAPHDHAWTTLSQAVQKHPDRRYRLRDLLMLRRALAGSTDEGLERLAARVRAAADRPLYQAMIDALATPDATTNGTRRLYLFMARVPAAPDGTRRAALRRASIEVAATGREERDIREAGHKGRRLGMARRAAGAAAAVVAAALTWDEPLMRGAHRAARAALVTPWWISSGRWRSLLEPPAARPEGPDPWPASYNGAVRALRVLGRIPLSPWRATCLYRSVAACIVLREAGVPAVLRIGAAVEAGDVKAHAWVEGPGGHPLYENPGGWKQLS